MEWDSFDSASERDSDVEEVLPTATQKGRKNIRVVKELEDLSLDTRIANRTERERIIRIENRQKKFKEVLGNEVHDQLILDYDFVNNVPLVSVDRALVQKMKHHQKEGVKFMWNSCYESLEQIHQSDGSGCILAHCMGLGKTFQVISLVHTVLNHTQVGTKKVLICCPKNTLMNWINEFQNWITPDLGCINIYNPTRFDSHPSRLSEIALWQANGGVCIINYELMRILLEDDKKDIKKERLKFYEYLCNPGPDLVICDEGHVLKNEETKLSKIMSQIRTMRRIILTGTPMQNNLKEYHCMVQFIKPNLLGTSHEFANMFVNPILNGQYENSLVEDVQLMKERSHILHKKLSGCIQRFDLSTLKMFLPEKREYVISVALTNSQIEMYRYYLKNYSAKGDPNWKNDSVALFADYQSLQRIWTHPYNLKYYAEKHQEDASLGKKKKKSKKKRKISFDEESGEESSDSGTFHWTRIPLFWWVRFVESGTVEDVRESNKLAILLRIINECEEACEKLLVFSGSLYSLHLIQYFLKKINDSDHNDPSLCNMTSTWEEELDYLVLTGNTSSEQRDRYCKSFNEKGNSRLRLFLISTKGGGIGINLTAANRAVLFDASWNPSHDIQSIFRIYRIGQQKPCYIYRLVASGTMEEKIYERQVAKESISHRVVDEKQIARHYTQFELLKLYTFEPNKRKKVKDMEPEVRTCSLWCRLSLLQAFMYLLNHLRYKDMLCTTCSICHGTKSDVSPKSDPLLKKILKEESGRIIGIHEHDSLLEHREEEELKELEKSDAWSAFNKDDDFKSLPEAEIKMLDQLTPESFDPTYLRIVLKKENPEAKDEEITLMMNELMPRINLILERPDFLDIMKNQALLCYKARNPRSEKPKGGGKQMKLKLNRKSFKEKENTIELKDTPEKGPEAETSRHSGWSDSDDSSFLYDLGSKFGKKKKKRKAKPLKVWGVRNGKRYGSPDKEG